jgi:hypothetical protein
MFQKDCFLYMLLYVYIGGYMYTTVRVSESTREKIEALKEHKRESVDEVLNKLLALVPEGDGEGKYTEEFRAGLLKSFVESKMGKTYSLSEVKKKLGL